MALAVKIRVGNSVQVLDPLEALGLRNDTAGLGKQQQGSEPGLPHLHHPATSRVRLDGWPEDAPCRFLISKKTPRNAGAALAMVSSPPLPSGAADALSSD